MNEFIINDRPLWLDYFNSQCGRCKLYDDTTASCKAFPDGIPFDMLEGRITHDMPIKGQQGDYLFTPEDSE